MQRAMSVAGTITGVREWRIGGEGEERKEYQQLVKGNGFILKWVILIINLF
jgi:hypothetical protein